MLILCSAAHGLLDPTSEGMQSEVEHIHEKSHASTRGSAEAFANAAR